MEKQIEQQVMHSYQQINNKWMGFHLRLLVVCNVIIGIVEISMFFLFLLFDEIGCSISSYWIKYIISPILINCLITLGAYWVQKKPNITTRVKQYSISFSYVLFTFILSLVHSGFVSILSALSFPIILTIMYEKTTLTSLTAIISSVLQLISGLWIFWDPDKIVSFSYVVNLAIVIFASFFVWLISILMIHFFKMKRDVFIKNDIERYQLQQRIHIDELTRVGNKYALEQYLNQIEMDKENIYYLAMFDLDDFKKLNDSYGHVFGDDVLRYIGDSLLTYCSKASSFRYGGDEFCVVFKNLSLAKIQAILNAVQNDISQHLEVPDQDFDVTVSVGIARFRQGYTPIKILECADIALYHSKRKSGNVVTVYEEMRH